MTNKDALYFLDEIEDTFRKTKMIYRHGKDEAAFDRAIERSENYIEHLREYFKNSVVLADVSNPIDDEIGKQLNEFAKKVGAKDPKKIGLNSC